MQNKIFGWIAGGTAAILLIPFVNMQMGGLVNWTLFDFMVMGLLIFIMASIFVFVARMVKSTRNRIIVAAIVGITFLYLWAELAVGIFTTLGS